MFPSIYQFKHSKSSNEEFSNKDDENTDWNNLKREAECSVELLNPASKKSNVVRQALRIKTNALHTSSAY